MERDPYVRIGRRRLYENPWLAVEVHEILHANGTPGEHLLIVTPPTCAVVVENAGLLTFAKQPRFGARRRVLEIVKGGAEPGEAPIDSAKRELREELGATADRWTFLGRLYEIPSIVAGSVAVYVARDVRFEMPQPETVESIESISLRFDEAIEAVLSGRIEDAVTVAALLRFAIAEGLLRRV
jgi:8-oxo-dGTP pyrophosphatase MutT (NUDIX family)